MSSNKCREQFQEWWKRNRTCVSPLEIWQAGWTASREEAEKELASVVPLFDESTPIYDVPVTYVDGGAMLPPKLAEDANAQ